MGSNTDSSNSLLGVLLTHFLLSPLPSNYEIICQNVFYEITNSQVLIHYLAWIVIFPAIHSVIRLHIHCPHLVQKYSNNPPQISFCNRIWQSKSVNISNFPIAPRCTWCPKITFLNMIQCTHYGQHQSILYPFFLFRPAPFVFMPQKMLVMKNDHPSNGNSRYMISLKLPTCSHLPDSLLSFWSKQTKVLLFYNNSHLSTCSWSGSEVLHTLVNLSCANWVTAWANYGLKILISFEGGYKICRGEHYPSENQLYFIYRLKVVIKSVYLYQFNVLKDLIVWFWSCWKNVFRRLFWPLLSLPTMIIRFGLQLNRDMVSYQFFFLLSSSRVWICREKSFYPQQSFW